MQAIVFDASIPRYLATRAAGALSPNLVTGPGRTARLGDVPVPELPGADWVRVRTLLGGICGSDVSMLRLDVSPSTSPFSSSPFVVGHENVGIIESRGPRVSGFEPGDRVVVNPVLSCRPRGIDPPCRHCAAGAYGRCENVTGGALAPGLILGTTRGLGGSWGEFYVAHESQLVRVPPGMSDETALLLEPAASALGPILAHPPSEGDRVLVIGAGAIGLLAVAALGAVAPRAQVTVVARHEFQAREASRLGAAKVVRPRRDDAHADELAAISGARLLKPILGPRIAVGGFDCTLVCVGTESAVMEALRFTRAGGSVLLIGNVARLPRVDWTPLWTKELTVHGNLCYGLAAHGGTTRHVFEIGMELFEAGLGERLAPLVTHRFPLARHRDALALAFGRSRGGALKIAFQFPR